MAIEMSINGHFEMNLKTLDGEPVSKREEATILSKLQSGDLYAGMFGLTIKSPDDFSKTLYTFSLEPMDDAEYNYDIMED